MQPPSHSCLAMLKISLEEHESANKSKVGLTLPDQSRDHATVLTDTLLHNLNLDSKDSHTSLYW